MTAELLRRGVAADSAAWVPLRCGLCEAEFDPSEGWLRRIRVQGHEVIRAIYGAVRDRNWRTVPGRVHGLHMVQETDQFRITFEVECVAPDIEFRWHAEVTGRTSNLLTFRFVGEAITGFWKNRIGLCVLHPLDHCAGQPCRIETCDGSVRNARFPELISPQQPFKNVRAINYQAGPDQWVEVRCEGDVFETEDQRNWTDASFKTYSTPLEKPFPAWIAPGARVEQSVIVQFSSAPTNTVAAPAHSGCVELSTVGKSARLPPIGFCLATDDTALGSEEVAALQRLAPAHLRVDLHLRDPAWHARWRVARKEAVAIGSALHVAFFLTDNAEQELTALAAEVADSRVQVALWLVFHEDEAATTARWIRMATAALPAGASIAAGTDASFAELNRARPGPDETALPCFPINPQVHASDDASLMENLAAQPETVATTWSFAQRSVVISPITLRPRRTPVCPLDVDARQTSVFGAAWTVASLARLAPLAGVHSLTYFETTGWRGVMASAHGQPHRELGASIPGGVFPMFHVFEGLARAHRITPTRSSDPMRFDGFCVEDADDRRCWIVANLTPALQRVAVLTQTSSARIQILDETNAAAAMAPPYRLAPPSVQETVAGRLDLELNAYAVAKITVPWEIEHG